MTDGPGTFPYIFRPLLLEPQSATFYKLLEIERDLYGEAERGV